MASQYERDESIRRATALLNGGYEASYVYEKLLSEGFNERDAKGLIFELTGKPLLTSSPSSASSEEPPAVALAPTEPQSLQELLNPASSNPVAETSTTAPAEATATSPSASEIQASNIFKQNQRTEAVRRAAEFYAKGYGSNYVYERMLREGFNEEEARAIVTRLSNRPTEQKVKRDYSPQGGGDQSAQVVIGIVMILIGCGITFFSYQAAANNPNGGTYVVTFGLVIAGAIRVFRGLSS